MNKEKIKFWGYIILFCTIITAIGGFYIGKVFGFSFIEVRHNNDTEILNENKEKINLVTKNIEKVIEVINEIGLDVTESKDYLSDVAPYIMEKLYDEEYEVINDYKIISNDNYQKLRNKFNVTLNDVTEDITTDNKYLHKGYRIGYKINNTNNNLKLELEDVERIGDTYSIQIKVNDVKQGIWKVKVNGEEIYYDSFVISNKVN